MGTEECISNQKFDIPGWASREEIRHNAIVYDYPCGVQDIICSTGDDFGVSGYEAAGEYGAHAPRPAPREAGKISCGDDLLRSMRRARAKVRRLALANEFQWFVTLTLDARMIDRYDGKAITRKLSQWCDNMVRRHGLRYILVPERHKDGAFHFHGFFAGDVSVQKSGHFDSAGHEIYNLPQWTYGFTAAIELYGEYASACSYVCKYIGKQGERALGRWYYSGGELHEPSKTYADFDYRELQNDYEKEAVEFEIPGRKLLVIHTKKE